MNGLPDVRMALFGSAAKTDRMRQRCKREVGIGLMLVGGYSISR
jgi:hypothetical protein